MTGTTILTDHEARKTRNKTKKQNKIYHKTKRITFDTNAVHIFIISHKIPWDAANKTTNICLK